MSPNTRKTFLFINIFAVLMFLLLSYIVDIDIFREFDYFTMVMTQQMMHRVVDIPFSLITLLGSSEATIIILCAIFLYVLWKKRKIFAGLVIFFFIYIFEIVFKWFIYQPNPPREFNRYALPFSLPSSGIVATQFSFPSGHIARSVFLAVIITFLISISRSTIIKKNVFYILLLFYMVVVLVSRVYLGAHWISDVLGGILLGGGFASLAIAMW